MIVEWIREIIVYKESTSRNILILLKAINPQVILDATFSACKLNYNRFWFIFNPKNLIRPSTSFIAFSLIFKLSDR